MVSKMNNLININIQIKIKIKTCLSYLQTTIYISFICIGGRKRY